MEELPQLPPVVPRLLLEELLLRRQRKRRKKKRVSDISTEALKKQKLTNSTEKEESDEDMGFGLFD